MKIFLSTGLIFLITSCANMVAPTGGDKDISPPQIQSILILDNEKSEYSKTLIFEFDEYIQLNRWDEYFYISPTIKKRAQKIIKGKKLFLTIEDTLNRNTNYYTVLNRCIKDNNEGNILDTLSYNFSINDSYDTLILSGSLLDAYTLSSIENAWVMLFNEDVNDTNIFNQTPHYIAKTDKNGFFHFPNLKDINYKIVALTDFDFFYDKQEKIAFSERIINARTDSFISLFGFDPIIEFDSIIIDSLKRELELDTSNSIIQESFASGTLEIILNKDMPSIFQLLQNEKVIMEISFSEKPYLIDPIEPGEYQLKYIVDANEDNIWNTGNWEMKMQPEKVVNYPSEIIIRSNWDLQLEWIISE